MYLLRNHELLISYCDINEAAFKMHVTGLAWCGWRLEILLRTG